MDNPDDQIKNDPPIRRHSGRFWVPLVLLGVGSVLLLRQMGVELPFWIFTWQFLLIGIGIISGLAHGFRGGGWLIMIFIGSFFLVDDFTGFSFHQYMWPVAFIAVGLFMLLRPRRSRWPGGENWDKWGGGRFRERIRQKRGYPGFSSGNPDYGKDSKTFTSENFIDVTTVFGGIHKNIVSKDFKGGDITIFMGGAEINLSQADIQGVARLDITQVMGGTKLIVPSNWEVRSQLTSIFGNVEDKRQSASTNSDKVLILDGSSVFGGIEIKNY
jgi:predicted membrane protein